MRVCVFRGVRREWCASKPTVGPNEVLAAVRRVAGERLAGHGVRVPNCGAKAAAHPVAAAVAQPPPVAGTAVAIVGPHLASPHFHSCIYGAHRGHHGMRELESGVQKHGLHHVGGIDFNVFVCTNRERDLG